MNRLIAGGWLFVGLFQALTSIQYTGFDPSFDPSQCALVLNQDSDANLLAGVFPYAATQTCITYDAVNQAYLDARKRIQITVPEGGNWKTEDIAAVGELLLDVSTQLAKTYGMSLDDIEKGLPLIDTSKTLIREVCPSYLADVQCHAGKYRRHDGLCNNFENPTWGATNTPFTRLLPPQFADWMTHPRQSVLGSQLPLPRIVSRTIHPDEGFHDHAGTVMVVAWGQFMDHDFTLTATPLDRFSKNEPEECCNRPPHLKHPYCMDIVIPEDDYFYNKYNVKCQDFVRSFPAPRPGCRLGSRTPFNTLTGVIDGNTVYGVTEEFGRYLRSGYSGLLRMNPVFSEFGLKDLLPLKLDYPDEGCTRANSTEYCFEAGEIRVNEQLVLACMHTLMAREHNRLARELSKINPHWDDETLYQEARRIVIAQIQHITYNEFLPIILGKEVMEKFGLITEKEGYWDGYDPTVNPNIIAAFSAAAFRFGHSLLPTAVERWSKAHKFIASKRLSELIRRPYDLYRAGVMDEYLMGLMNQVAQAMDDSITQEVTNHLFKKQGARFGLDLVAFNMQRGREFGVPGYMQFRKFCGLPVSEDFLDLFGTMPNTTVQRYMQIFQHTMDVDLWSGGVSEKPLPGSMIGPTFACIIATQMSYLRRGDRFWYELPNQPSSFTPEQLQEIRKTKLSKIICDNTDLIDTIQVYPMVLPDYEINPRVPCRSGILPTLDLTKWAEYDVNQDVRNSAGKNEDVKNSRVSSDELYTKAIFININSSLLNMTNDPSIKVAKVTELPENSTYIANENSLKEKEKYNSGDKPMNGTFKGEILTKGGINDNKLKSDRKVAGKTRRKRQAADYYDDYEGDYDHSPKSRPTDDYYDQYDHGKNPRNQDYDSSERDTYDIHGYNKEAEATRSPQKQYQPAYTIKGKGKSSSGLNSGRPVVFSQGKPKRPAQYYKGNRHYPGGATSTSQITMSHKAEPNGDHHHHHYYDGLKETHYRPKGVSQTTYDSDGPVKVYRQQSGKHKHYHHVKIPSKNNKEMTSSEEEEYFNPEELTTKELEDIYKTYDDADIARDVFLDTRPKRPTKTLFPQVAKSKEEVDNIFKKVQGYLSRSKPKSTRKTPNKPKSYKNYWELDYRIRK